MSFFEGFELEHVDVGTATLRMRHGGSGPVVLLLHGHPRTHTTWYRVAPLLVDAGFTVVCADLPGYGESRRTVGDFTKKAMAGDLATLMERFGAFSVVGHDRGTGVAHRLAVEGHAERLVVLDGLPITEHLERCDDRFAAAWWHWFFFTQTDKPAEAIINRDPDFWYRADPAKLGPENYADWWRAVHTPEVVFAMVNEYRAGLNVDRHDEAADRAAGRLVDCPTLVGWSLQDDLEELHGDPVAIWRTWATGPLEGVTIDSGHHMAEEAPEAVAAALVAFLR
ncbi:alpha/beta hydrolase [Solirubrobacter taibaiensis]|nr:alpha/beta hydrolase [Solirubrobacter taibaiensis]